jgi:hypothetical protein
MAGGTNGNCYLCGAALGKTAMHNHVLKTHGVFEDGQQCYLLKIEGAYSKDYWLYVDVPVTASLSGVDAFLRKIWLECCGHLSAFHGSGRSEIGKARKLNTLAVGDQLEHEYDFGDTTESVITIVGETTRKTQKDAVRLLARNIPPVFQCSVCGKPAAAICTECSYETDNPFFCDSCAEKHEHEDMLLPVTNSPRMGVCGYDGELDVFAFKPDKSAG